MTAELPFDDEMYSLYSFGEHPGNLDNIPGHIRLGAPLKMSVDGFKETLKTSVSAALIGKPKLLQNLQEAKIQAVASLAQGGLISLIVGPDLDSYIREGSNVRVEIDIAEIYEQAEKQTREKLFNILSNRVKQLQTNS